MNLIILPNWTTILSFEINDIFQFLNKNTYFIGKSLEIQPTPATTAAAAAAAAAPSIIISLLVHTSYLQKGEGRVKLLSFQNTTRSGQVKLLASNTCSAVNFTSFLKEDGRKPYPYVSLPPSNFPIVCKPIVVSSAWKKGRFWVVWDGADRCIWASLCELNHSSGNIFVCAITFLLRHVVRYLDTHQYRKAWLIIKKHF